MNKVESAIHDVIIGNYTCYPEETLAKVCEDVAVGFVRWYDGLTGSEVIALGLEYTNYKYLYNFYVQNILDQTKET